MAKKIFLAALVALAAVGFIVVYLMIIILTTASLSSLKKPIKPVTKPTAEQIIPLKTADCQPAPKTITAVGGLNRNDVPRLPDALRVNYDNQGQSQYSTRQKERTIFEYYLSQLSSQCWELTALKPSEALWTKGNQFLKITVAENPLGGKTLVSYAALSPRVLGTFYIAQTCAEGEVYCQGSGCLPAGSTCPTTTTTSCTSSFAQNSTYACNYSACPNGCTYNGPSGCPDGCYTPPASTTCTSQYSLNGTYSCNYSSCPNGCTFNGPGGCPDGCYTPPAATTCTGEYQQPGTTSPACNYTKCPNGCSWSTGANSCPTGCQSATSCTGGQVWCTSSSGSGGWCQTPPCPSTTSACASGYYWCSSTNSCISNNTTCTTTGSETCPSGQIRCYSTGSPSGWCQASPCPSSTPTTTTCPSSTYQMPGSTAPACNYTTCPSGCTWDSNGCPNGCQSSTSCSSGQIWCTSSSGSGGWCQTPPCPTTTSTSCASGYYWCSSTNSCISNNSSCSTTPTTTACPTGQYLCNNTCVPSGSACNGYSTTPSPTTPTPVKDCGQCKTWKNDRCELVPLGTPNPANCGTNGVCDKYGGCVTLRTGQTFVGDGAICGNGWCDEARGENKVNCPKECYNEPPKPPTPPPPPTNTNANTALPEPPRCQAGYYWCPEKKACLTSSDPCPATIQPTQPTIPTEGYAESGPGGPAGEEEREQRMDEERLQRMKKEVKMLEKMITEVKKRLTKMQSKLKKYGIQPPQELTAALAEAPKIIDLIKKAKTIDDLGENEENIYDVMQTLGDWGPRLHELERLAEDIRNGERESKNIERTVKKIQGYVKRTPILESYVNELKALADEMLLSYKTARELAKTDAEAALDEIQNFWGGMEEFWNAVSKIEMVRNIPQGIRNAENQIRNFKNRLRSLEKNKTLDKEMVNDLKSVLTNLEAKLKEIKQLSKQKPLDLDVLMEEAANLWEQFNDFENRLAEMGQSLYGSAPIKTQEYVLPDSFRFK